MTKLGIFNMAQEKVGSAHVEGETTVDRKDPDAVVAFVEDVTPAGIQAQFPCLRDLEVAEMVALEKKVLRKLDWRLLPTITIMFLMK